MSYLMDIPVERLDSPSNGTLELIIRDGRYALICGNAIYSFEDKYYNFSVGLQRVKLDPLLTQSILILGWGLGSIQQIIENSYPGKKLNIHAVENDESIVRLYKMYIQKKCFNKPIFHIEDAASFIESNQMKYRLIIIDIFIEDTIPQSIQNISFLNYIKKSLAKDGLVIFNTIDHDSEQQNENNSLKQKFNTVFNDLTTLKISQNELLLNTNKYSKKRNRP